MPPVFIALSFALNLAALVAASVLIRGRGGLAYLKAALLRDPSAHRDPGSKVRTEIFDMTTVPATSRPIIFLGDSLTFEGTWNEFFRTNAPALNRGIGGETSPDVLRRVPQITALKPAAVFLMVGANDSYFLKFSPWQTADTIRQIVAKILSESPDTVVYVQAVLPSAAPRFVHWGERVNDLIANLADGRSVFFLSFRDAFMRDGLIAPHLTSDGLHLSAAGYEIWRGAVAPAVAEAVRRRDLPITSAPRRAAATAGAAVQ